MLCFLKYGGQKRKITNLRHKNLLREALESLKLVKEGIDNGEFYESDVEATASAIFGVTVSSLLYRLKKNRKVDVEKIYTGFIDNVTRTLSKNI
mgnify:CR=1 FL=1